MNGSFLRSDLGSFLHSNGVSSEGVLNVEYTRALLPPSYQASFQHDDWVGAVDVLSSTSPVSSKVPSGQPRILSGSFDGLLRVWNPSGATVATSSLCTAAPCQSIYSAQWLSSSRIVSSGFGVPIRLWSYSEPDLDGAAPSPNTTGTLQPQLDLYGHSGASNSLAIHHETERILSAGDDGTLALFSSTTDSSTHGPIPSFIKSPTTPISKRRRLSTPNKPTTTPRFGPLSITNAQPSNTTTQTTPKPLTATIFHPTDPSFAYTTSRDRTLRTHDLTTTTTLTTLTPQPSASLTCLASLPQLNLLAAGTSAHNISLVDPRVDTKSRTTEIARCTGFRNEVRCVVTSPESSYQIAGASFDGTVRIFDVRDSSSAVSSSSPSDAPSDLGNDVGVAGNRIRQIYKIPRRGNPQSERVAGGEGVKVFGLCWDGEVGVVSGGEDGGVQINRAG